MKECNQKRKIRNPFRDLSPFEWGLWITSLAVVSASYLLCPDKDLLTLCASLVGVTALIFVAKGYVLGQALIVVFSVFYGIVSFYFRYYGEMFTYLCMSAPSAVFAMIAWLKNPYAQTAEVKVSRLSSSRLWAVIGLTVAATAASAPLLWLLGTNNLLFSVLSVTTSFFASALTFLRSPYYALAYAANDVVLIVLWILAAIADPAYLPMILCFVMFLVNDLYGFINWKRMERRQAMGNQ